MIQIPGHACWYEIDQDWIDVGRVEPLSDVELAALMQRGHARVINEGSNLVVDLGLSAISRLIGHAVGTPDISNGTDTESITDISDLQITEIRVGADTSPTAPAAGDNDIETDPDTYIISSPTVSYPTDYSVRIDGLIPASTLDGVEITEHGLFMSVGALFARYVHDPPFTVQTATAAQVQHTIGDITAS